MRQEYQKAITATSENIAEPSTSRPSSTSRIMTDMVNGEVSVLCMNRRGTVTLQIVSAIQQAQACFLACSEMTHGVAARRTSWSRKSRKSSLFDRRRRVCGLMAGRPGRVRRYAPTEEGGAGPVDMVQCNCAEVQHLRSCRVYRNRRGKWISGIDRLLREVRA